MKRLLGLVVSIVAACVGVYVGQTVVAKLFAHARAAHLSDWHTRSAAGLSFDAPGELKPEALDFGPVQPLLESSEYHTFRVSGFEVGVIRAAFKPDASLNIDGAATGAVENVSKLEGVKNIQHSVESTTISGKPARRISMNADRWGGRIYNESLVILDGQTMYQVQATYDSNTPNAAGYARRVIDSVQFKP
jgi:hypothetical protein